MQTLKQGSENTKLNMRRSEEKKKMHIEELRC